MFRTKRLLRVQGQGSRVKGLRFRVYDVGFQVQGLGLSVPDSRVKYYWLMVSSLVFRVCGVGFQALSFRFVRSNVIVFFVILTMQVYFSIRAPRLFEQIGLN